MKRKNIIFLGLTLLVIFSFSLTILAKEQVFDFRKTNWGMNMKEVKATEDREPDLEVGNSALVYKMKINTKDFTCIYRFSEDKLYNGGYVLSEEHI